MESFFKSIAKIIAKRKMRQLEIEHGWIYATNRLHAAAESACLAEEGKTFTPKQATQMLRDLEYIEAQLQKHAYRPGNEGVPVPSFDKSRLLCVATTIPDQQGDVRYE